MKRTQPRQYSDIECEIDGKFYRGRYFIEKGMITVDSDLGSKSAVVRTGNAGAMGLARILLRELAAEERQRLARGRSGL